MKLSLATCAQWMDGELLERSLAETLATGYSIDSRTIQPGDLFFAVSGDRFDAHSFVAGALEKGAAGAVIAQARLEMFDPALRARLIAVDEPLSALQRLGAATRRSWGGPVVGITGSAGKTTTKEMVAAVLGAKHNVLKSAGNLNNHFGVPLQLLRLEPEHEYAVIEMGMSHAGEIAALARIASPNWGVVTNVGVAHAEGFADGVEGIARAKRELIDSLDPEQGIAFLNADDPRVAGFARTFNGRSVLAGRGVEADVRATEVRELGTDGLALEVHAANGEQAAVRLHLLGAHNAQNALLALAVGQFAGVSLAEGAAALAALQPGDKRGEMLAVRGATLINDCYNSNPAALQAMIATLMQVPGNRHILVAGEMRELGPDAAALHGACGEAAVKAGVDVILGVLGFAHSLVEAAQAEGGDAQFFATAKEAGAWLDANLTAGDVVLLKGSRGVQLERALDSLGISSASH